MISLGGRRENVLAYILRFMVFLAVFLATDAIAISDTRITDLIYNVVEGKERVTIKVEGPAIYRWLVQDKPDRIVLEFRDATIPRQMEIPVGGEGIISSVKAMPVRIDSTRGVSVTLYMRSKAGVSVKEDVGKVYVEVSRPSPPPFRRVEQKKISLVFKEEDIKNVLKILSAKAGINVVAGPDVRGTVTIKLDDIDPLDALKVILKTAGYTYERDGEVYRVIQIPPPPPAPQISTKIISLRYIKAKDFAEKAKAFLSERGTISVDEATNTVIAKDISPNVDQVVEIATRMDVAPPPPPLLTKTFRISYANLDSIAATLEKMKSDRGSITKDLATGSIVVMDTEDRIKEMEGYIRFADTRPKLLLIESTLMETSASEMINLGGVSWKWTRGTESIEPGFPFSVSGLSVGIKYGVVTPSEVQAIIGALVETRKGDILASPVIAVKDGQQATIHIGDKIAYRVIQETALGRALESVSFETVGIVLRVTPTVMPDGYISMKIHIESSDATERTSAGIPIISTKETDVDVLVKEGNSIVIGGLKKKRSSESISKIPILGDLPILDFFFRRKLSTEESNSLTVFITPRIVGD